MQRKKVKNKKIDLPDPRGIKSKVREIRKKLGVKKGEKVEPGYLINKSRAQKLSRKGVAIMGLV